MDRMDLINAMFGELGGELREVLDGIRSEIEALRKEVEGLKRLPALQSLQSFNFSTAWPSQGPFLNHNTAWPTQTFLGDK